MVAIRTHPEALEKHHMPKWTADDELDVGDVQEARGAELGSLGTEALIDRFLGKEDTIDVGGPVQDGSPVFQKCNKATMECLRGPCRHLWQLTVRLNANVDKIRVARVRQCNANPTDPTDLTDQNVYHCDQWWPQPLSWVPIWLQSLARPKLRAAWEKLLKKAGYSFAWRTWKDGAFEADQPEQRKPEDKTKDLYF